MEGALKDMRGKDTVIDSQTGDEQFDALQKYGHDLTAQAAHLDPVSESLQIYLAENANSAN